MMSFDPSRHMMNLRSKDYLPVAARIAWFREDHPDWGIVTEPHEIGDSYAIFRASIFNPEGRLIATATKREDREGFPDFWEKAETGSVGRALAMCGYGTLQAQEFDETPRIVDTPQPAPAQAPQRQQIATAPANPAPDREALARAKAEWRDICGAAGIDEIQARGELLNVILGRPRESRDAVSVGDYMRACELLSVEGIPTGFFDSVGAGEGGDGDGPGELFGPDEGVAAVAATATSAIAGGL
jgi:hypothetical protein